jgi:hypothetical protein
MTAIAQAHPNRGIPPIHIHNDPVDWPRMPQEVKTKQKKLRRERLDALRALQAVGDERREILDRKQAVESSLRSMTGGRPDSAFYHSAHAYRYQSLADDHPEVATAKQALADLIADLAKLAPVIAERSHRSQQLGRLLNSVEDYLKLSLRGVAAITVYKGATPILSKRQTATDAVARCRGQLLELDANRHKIASAPWHSAEAKRRAAAEVATLAERGRPSVLPLLESPTDPIHWAERPYTEAVIADHLISEFGDPACLPLMFWMLEESITAKLQQEIDELADDRNSLTAKERAERISEIDRERLAVERQEEFWVSKCIDDGLTILRRPSADVRALLNLADHMPASPQS